jgi:MinD-like ATPase involved in chromosome partitioning or flagellar assembly
MGQVREDSRRVEHAMNDGKLVKDLYPKSEVAVDLARLVGLLSDDPDELAAAASEPAKASKGFFARLFGRA